MNREQIRKMKKNNNGENIQLKFILNILEEFNKLNEKERLLSIMGLRKEIYKMENEVKK